MALNKISSGRRTKFDPDSVVGDIVIHSVPPHAGQLMLETVRRLAEEQVACRIPKRYRSNVIFGRVMPNPMSGIPVEQSGYDYWFYLPRWAEIKKGE